MIKEPDVAVDTRGEPPDPLPQLLNAFHARIRQKSANRSEAPVVIVALGDSVTQGLAGVNEFLHGQTYHCQLKRLLDETYPLCIFSVINAGVEGNSADSAIETQLARDVISRRPDLVLIAFGLNDAAIYGLDGVDAFARLLHEMIRTIRQQTSADVILLTPNMMLSRLNDQTPAEYIHLQERFLKVQQSGLLRTYSDQIVTAGREAGVAVADVYACWERWAQSGDIMDLLANGLNHPNARGHALAARCLMDVITASSH